LPPLRPTWNRIPTLRGAICWVVIRLHLNVRSCPQDAPPTTQQIAPRKVGILFHVGRRGGRVGRDPHFLSGNTFVEVTLNRQCVATAQVPIRSETALAHPPVVELMVIGMKLGTAGEALTVDSVVEVLAFPSSKAKADEALIDIAAAGGYKHSMGVLGTLSDDIDDPIYGIRSPNRASRPADDFDPLDIFEQRI